MSNLSDLLRSFLGFPRRDSGSFEHDGDATGAFDGRHEADPFDWSPRNEDDVFPSFSFAENEAFRDFQSAFRHMEELMSGFHQSFGNFHDFGMPLPPADRHDVPPDSRDDDDKTIRDRMLKGPNVDGSGSTDSSPWRQRPSRGWPFTGDYRNRRSNVEDKVDQDLDAELEQRGATLSDVLPSYGAAVGPRTDSPASTASTFRFTSVRTIRKPDGSVETHRITRGSDGTEEEVVTRMGPNGEEERVTTRRDARGNVLSEPDDRRPTITMPKSMEDDRQLQENRPRTLVERLKEYFRPR